MKILIQQLEWNSELKLFHVIIKILNYKSGKRLDKKTFRAITKSYYRGSTASILIYDVTKRSSFNNITSWIDDLKKMNIDNQFLILVGNKTDLIESRQVEKEEGEQLAQNHGLLFKEISVKM